MDIDTIKQKLRVVRERPSRIADYLREPRDIVVGGAIANALGLQLARIAKDTLAFRLRATEVPERVRVAAAELDREGILVIPNFLPEDAFSAVQRELATSLTDHPSDWRHISFGKNFSASNLYATDFPERYPAMCTHVQKNDFLLQLACAVSRRRPTYWPHVDVQRLTKEDWKSPHTDLDYNQYMHSDRHYPFVKAFLYMTDVDAETAPYTFARRTHKMWSVARLRYEYRFSNRFVRARRGRYARTGEQLIADRALRELADEFLSDVDATPEPVVGRANTLIISNNQGFHRRGELRGDRPRMMMFIDYKYLESPAQWMYPILRHLYR